MWTMKLCFCCANVGSFSRPSLAAVEVDVYLHDFDGNLDARRSSDNACHGEGHAVYGAQHGATRCTRVGTFLERCTHQDGRRADLR